MVLCQYVTKFEESGKALRKGVQVKMEDKEGQVETEGRGGADQEEMGVRWNGGASQTDKHLWRLCSIKEVETGLWNMKENVGQVEGCTWHGQHFDLGSRAMGSH